MFVYIYLCVTVSEKYLVLLWDRDPTGLGVMISNLVPEIADWVSCNLQGDLHGGSIELGTFCHC